MPNLLPWIFFGIGISFVSYCQLMASRARRSRRWISAPGEITRSEIVTESSRRLGTINRVYKAMIEYTYRVGDRTYRSDRIHSGGTLDASQRGLAEEHCARYPLGAAVRVFYDPSKPASACLERTAEGTALFTLLGLALIVLSVFLYFGLIELS